MKPNILWMFFVTASLVSANSQPSFQASCSLTGCGGSYDGNTFTFGTPFPDGAAYPLTDPTQPFQPFMDFSVGTYGGTYTYGGHTCDYDVVLGGQNCDGTITYGALIGPPSATGLLPGAVVNVSGAGFAQGSFCWDGNCPTSGPPPPLFDVPVDATYQFTLTNPGTAAPFDWTGAQFSSVPEPGNFLFTLLGLVSVVALWRLRRCRS